MYVIIVKIGLVNNVNTSSILKCLLTASFVESEI
jgi:hypothetical protein